MSNDAYEPNADLYRVPFLMDDYRGMPYRYLGSSGLRAPNIGLGTWKFGLPETGDGSRVDERTAFAIFDRAMEFGVTLWDTANRYNDGSGNSERIIGRWFEANRAERRNVLVATKLFGGMDGRTPNHCGLSRSNIVDSVAASLRRLRTDYIDLLYFHSYDPRVPMEESLAAVEDLVRQGAVRYLAVSNFTAEQLRGCIETSSRLSVRCRPVAVQNQFDPVNGELRQPGVLEESARSGVSFVAWSPLGGGLLSGKYVEPEKAGAGDRLFDEGKLDIPPAALARMRRLAQLARGWGMELPELALAYMLQLPGMGPVIPAASSVKQLEANARAGKLTLDREQTVAVAAALAAAGSV